MALHDNIERLKLSVDQILPLHGRKVPLAELQKWIGKASYSRHKRSRVLLGNDMKGGDWPLTISDAMGRGGNSTDHLRKSIGGVDNPSGSPFLWVARLRHKDFGIAVLPCLGGFPEVCIFPHHCCAIYAAAL